MSGLVSDTHLRSFNEDGVVCLRGVIPRDLIDGMAAAVDEQIAGCGATRTGYNFEDISRQVWSDRAGVQVGEAARFDMGYVGNRIRADAKATPLLEAGEGRADANFFYDVAGWRDHAAIRNVALDSDLPEITAQLLGSQTVHFWEDTTFVKTPGTRQKTAFHQDYAYFQISGEQCVVVWAPLDRAGPQNGVTRYVRGSHKWGKVYAPNLVIAQTTTTGATDEQLPDIEGHEDEYDIVSFDVAPGDVIIHHVMTVHGAGGNMSTRDRRALSFRYCGDDVRYYDRPGAIPQNGVSHQLQDGDRLHAHDYPLVFPKPWPGLKLSPLWSA